MGMAQPRQPPDQLDQPAAAAADGEGRPPDGHGVKLPDPIVFEQEHCHGKRVAAVVGWKRGGDSETASLILRKPCGNIRQKCLMSGPRQRSGTIDKIRWLATSHSTPALGNLAYARRHVSHVQPRTPSFGTALVNLEHQIDLLPQRVGNAVKLCRRLIGHKRLRVARPFESRESAPAAVYNTSMRNGHLNADARQDRGFATTHWTLVFDAGAAGSPEATIALAELCGRYWYPLYTYVRRRGYQAAEAQDLTQEFFARLLEKNTLAQAAPERGRFRTFLLASLGNFLANEWDRQTADKRGGSRRVLSLDLATGEARLLAEPAAVETPERLFERQWACTLLDAVAQRLRDEFAAAGKERQFELLQPALAAGGRGANYAEIGRQLGLSDEAARQAASRLRRRYRELLRTEVAATVADPDQVDEEIRSLFAAVSA